MKNSFPILLGGALAMVPWSGYAQNPGRPADPFERNLQQPPAAVQQAANNGPVNLSIRFESFSLDLKTAAELLRQQSSDTELYNTLVAKLASKEVTQETMIIARARSGEKALVEGITEIIYPTEYEAAGENWKKTETMTPVPTINRTAKPTDPPLPNGTTTTTTGGEKPGVIVPAFPTSFETRHTGWTLEIEPTLSSDRSIIDLRISPSFTKFTGMQKNGQGVSQTEMPTFDSRRAEEAVTIKPGKPVFLSTFSRSAVSQDQAEQPRRTNFAFVTADLSRP